MWNYRPTAAVAVPYIAVNVHNHFRPVVMVTNNLAGLILSKVGRRDLGMCFSNQLNP